MEPVSSNNEKGFTLIEFLVALVILSIGMLGLLQAVSYSFQHNMVNELRDDAVRLADERMLRERSKTFEAISSGDSHDAVKLNVMNGFKNYSVERTTVENSYSVKTISINVKWKYKGKEYEHAISSMVSRQ